MALEINALKRVFQLKRGSNTLELDDPDSSLSLNEVMDFYFRSLYGCRCQFGIIHGIEVHDFV